MKSPHPTAYLALDVRVTGQRRREVSSPGETLIDGLLTTVLPLALLVSCHPPLQNRIGLRPPGSSPGCPTPSRYNERREVMVMSKKLTWEEIRQRYPDEWVVLVDFSVDENQDLEAGVVYGHGPDLRLFHGGRASNDAVRRELLPALAFIANKL